MWCAIEVNFSIKMFYIILILSFTSFVNPMPASTFIVPSYPPQLALFTRFDNPKSTVVRDEVPRKFSSKDEFTNWASYAMRVMAAKLNNTFFSIKDKMKKSVSDDDVKREPFQRASNFESSVNRKKTVDRNKNMNNSESITKMDLVASTMVANNVVPDMVSTNTVLNNMVANSTESTNVVSTIIPTTTVSANNIESTTTAPAEKEIRDMKSVDMITQKQIEELDSGKNDDPKKMIHAERRQFNLPIKTFGDPALFNPHFSLADDPRDYQHFSNYLSQLFANHYDIGENKIIIRAPDFLPPVPTPAAYIPLFVQHPDYSGYQDGQVIKNQFGGGDGGTNSKNDLAALRASAPSMPSISSTTAIPSTTSTTSTTTTTTTETPAPKTEVEDFSKPIKLLDASRESIRPLAEIRPIISVPFEAIITITRESHPTSSTPLPSITPISSTPSISSEKLTTSLPINLSQDSRNYYEIVTRDPPDDFPPFFKRNNSFSNEFGNVDVVFQDEIAKNRDQNYNKKVYKNTFKIKDIKDRKKDCNHNSVTDESSSVNVVVENEITKNKDKNNDNYNQNRFLDDDVTIEEEDLFKKTNKNKKDRSRKRQTSAFKQLLQILGFSKKKTQKSNSTDIQLSTSPVVKVFTTNRVPGAKFEQTPPLRGRRNQTLESQESPENPDIPKNEVIPINENPSKTDDTSQNQEFDDDNEEEGSLGSITDLLPLVIPVLEDLSDPDSDTDLAELLEGAIPLLQGLSEGENDDGTPINLGATISPIIQTISAGKDGQDSNSAAIITPIISLAAPLIGPILGPVIGPLLRSSSNPSSEGSSLPALINAITGPLLQPTEEGGTSPLSNLIAEIIFELSKDLSAAGKEGIDLGGVISSVISGVLAGTSASLSGGKDKHKPDSYGAYTNNGHYDSYGQAPVPANSVNPISLIFTTVKDILNSSINAISGLLGASSASSSTSSDDSSAPPPAYGPPNYKPPSPHSSYNNKFSSQKKPQKNSFSRT